MIGESGSGKSVSVMTMLGLIPRPPGRVVSGEAFFKGHDLLTDVDEASLTRSAAATSR